MTDATKAVQKAIQDSTDATNGDVAAFLRSLLDQGFYLARVKALTNEEYLARHPHGFDGDR